MGWAGGIDRMAMMLSDEGFPPPPRPLAIALMDEAYDIKGLELAQCLRKEGYVVQMTYGGNLGKRLKKATQMNAQYVLILGEEEVSSHTVVLKNLDTGEQERLSVDQVSVALNEKGIS